MIEYYINELITEGVSYIPPWECAPAEVTKTDKEEDPSQDSGLRSRSDSVGSQHSQHSLILGATAASMQRKSLTPPEGIILPLKLTFDSEELLFNRVFFCKSAKH